MAITKLSKDLAVIAKLDDEPNDVGGLSPAGLKSKFDENGLAIQSYLNDVLLPALEGLTGAENIGGSVDSVTVKTVQAILSAFETRIAERYTKAEDNALVGAETKDLVKSVDLNLTTGVLTVVKKDGTTLSWDTALEKVPANFVLEETAAGTFLVITNVDGSTSRANLGDLVDTYTFNNGDQIAFNTTGAANNKTITATIRANSIGIDKLTLSAVGQLEGYVSAASGSATDAAGSASAADKSKLAAETAKTGAETAQKNAETAKTAAESAKTAAALSESGSAENARIAGVKATEASGSAAAALASKNAAAGSATAADTSAKTAETAKTAAGNAAGAADASATAAAGSAGAAATAKAAAETAKTGAETAQRNAETAKTAAESAKTAAAGSETGAAGSATTATEKAKTATDKATLAQSYAVGGTGTRVGEDLDNAKYYKDQAQAIVGGDYPTKAEAQGYATTAKDAAISAASTDATAKADAARDASVPLAQKGAAGGVATLDGSGVIPSGQLPSYVDDVLELELKSQLPAVGEQGKIYLIVGDTDKNNGQYRWTGTTYAPIIKAMDYATKAEAEAGVENTKVMTSLRTTEAIKAQAATKADIATAKADVIAEAETMVASSRSIAYEVGELEDYSVESGRYANAGAGWNAYKFHLAFEGVPRVVVTAENFAGIVQIKDVSATGFSYCLMEINPTPGTVTTGKFFTGDGTGTNPNHKERTFVTDVVLPTLMRTTVDMINIDYIAIEYGGD